MEEEVVRDLLLYILEERGRWKPRTEAVSGALSMLSAQTALDNDSIFGYYRACLLDREAIRSLQPCKNVYFGKIPSLEITGRVCMMAESPYNPYSRIRISTCGLGCISAESAYMWGIRPYGGGAFCKH